MRRPIDLNTWSGFDRWLLDGSADDRPCDECGAEDTPYCTCDDDDINKGETE